METKQDSKSVKAKTNIVTTAPVRVKRETRKKVLQELAKANKKDFGRNLRAEDLIAFAITLVQPEHIKQLQESTLSNGDRLEQKFKDYVARYGSLSKDEFLGKLLAGEMDATNVVKTQSP